MGIFCSKSSSTSSKGWLCSFSITSKKFCNRPLRDTFGSFKSGGTSANRSNLLESLFSKPISSRGPINTTRAKLSRCVCTRVHNRAARVLFPSPPIPAINTPIWSLDSCKALRHRCKGRLRPTNSNRLATLTLLFSSRNSCSGAVNVSLSRFLVLRAVTSWLIGRVSR